MQFVVRKTSFGLPTAPPPRQPEHSTTAPLLLKASTRRKMEISPTSSRRQRRRNEAKQAEARRVAEQARAAATATAASSSGPRPRRVRAPPPPRPAPAATTWTPPAKPPRFPWMHPPGPRRCEHSPLAPTICRVCDGSNGVSWAGWKPPKKPQAPAAAAAAPAAAGARDDDAAAECKHRAGCQLRATKGCCACEDVRPVAATYWAYRDGRGMVAVAARDAFYCPGCRSSAARRRAEAGPAPSEDPQRVRLAEEETASVGGFGAVGRSAERLAPAVANLCLGSDNNDGRNVDPASTSKGTTAESTNPAEGPSMQDRDDSEDNDGGDSATAVTASSGWSRIVAGEIHADSGYDVGTNGAGGLVQPAVKGCGHRCLMRHSPECCLCGDVRPQAERYWVFILRDEFDSLRTEAEVVETVDRTALYCTECRAAGEV